MLTSLIQTFTVMLFTTVLGVSALCMLFFINLIFPPALLLTLPLKFLICAWMLAWTYLDYPLARRGLGVRSRLRWVAQRFGAFSTFGLAWTGLLLVTGGLALLFLPMGVAGATRLVVEGERSRP